MTTELQATIQVFQYQIDGLNTTIEELRHENDKKQQSIDKWSATTDKLIRLNGDKDERIEALQETIHKLKKEIDVGDDQDGYS